MARVTSLIKLRGTYDGVTYVKSTKYGDHIRAKRGTHKKAVLNEAYKKQNKKLVKSNTPAKIIKDAINPYRSDFYDGSLWPRLVSMTNHICEDGESFDFAKLEPCEVHDKYRLERFHDVKTHSQMASNKSELHVVLLYNVHPEFTEGLEADGYRIGVIAIFPDIQNKTAKTEAVDCGIVKLTDGVFPFYMRIPVPPTADAFIICVRVDACEHGKSCEPLAAKGMKIVQAGTI